VTHLTRDALGAVDITALAPVKKLVKQFFSDAPWTADDDRALGDLVGPGDGWWRYPLDDDFALEFGWRAGAFRIELASRHVAGESFAGPVVPEATPNPRTIRFVTPPIHDGPSRWYASAADVDDPRVARLFAEFDDVANVLVGPDFIAVGLSRTDRWEHVLDAVLSAITTVFAAPGGEFETSDDPGIEPRHESPRTSSTPARAQGTALDRAWKDLGSLRPDNAADLGRILSAVSSTHTADRQVAARLLVDADTKIAERSWGSLLDDRSRSVRRAVVDAMVDAERPAVRPLLERALRDVDAWTRWKALRGLVDIGVAPSRASVAPLADDPDFRVRLEALRALADV
jgi:hypothetical protein